MAVDHKPRLRKKVSEFLRIPVSDPNLDTLIDAALEYLENAGVTAPEEGDKANLWDLAVTLYVNTIWSGGEDKLGDAMVGIVHQLR